MVGKSERTDRRQAERIAAAEAAQRAGRRRRWLALGVSGAVIAIGAVVAVLVIGTSGGSSALPAGTQTFPENVHTHVLGPVHYNRNPPAGGAHSAVWLNCGIYTQPVPNVHAVHSLEHGAVWITYRPNLSSLQISQLEGFVQAHYDGPTRYLILSPYPGLPAPVVASAWGAQIRLNGPGDPRLGAFVAHFIGGAQGGEPGGPCTGGTGTPTG